MNIRQPKPSAMAEYAASLPRQYLNHGKRVFLAAGHPLRLSHPAKMEDHADHRGEADKDNGMPLFHLFHPVGQHQQNRRQC